MKSIPAGVLIAVFSLAALSAGADTPVPTPTPAPTPASAHAHPRRKTVAKEFFWLTNTRGPSTRVTLLVPDESTWDGGAYDVIHLERGKDDVLEVKDVYGDSLQPISFSTGAEIKRTKYVDLIALDAKGASRGLLFHLWPFGGLDHYLFFGLAPDGKLKQFAEIEGPVVKIVDYDHDGLADVLIKGGWTGQGSYYPFLVYRQGVKDGVPMFELDEALSQKWSAENHYAWHGPKYREDISGSFQN